MTRRQHAPGSPDQEIASSLLNETGLGMGGCSGFSAHRNGTDWATVFTVRQVRRPGENQVELVCEDSNTEVRARFLIGLDPDSTLMTCETQIENLSGTDLFIDDLTLVKQLHRRQALDPEVPREFLLLVCIDLGDLELTVEFGSEFFQDGCYRKAGLAPIGPEIHQHRLLN